MKGTYAVTLTVTDAAGATAPASFSVVVQQTPVVQPPPTHYVNSSGAVSFTSGTGLGLVIGILLLLVIVLVLAALLAMRRRSPPGPPSTIYYTSPPPSPGSVPPPGAGGPPSP